METEEQQEEEPVTETPKGKAAKKVAEEQKKDAAVPATPSDKDLPEFDPDKFTPGYVPKTNSAHGARSHPRWAEGIHQGDHEECVVGCV